MVLKKIINAKRLRTIQGSFGWIDHRFITAGFLEQLTAAEIPLYLFLVAVADRNGLSFYADQRICRLLKMDLSALGDARRGLCEKSLVAYDPPLYQVLSLPKQPVTPSWAHNNDRRQRNLKHLQTIKEMLT
jgi:hypothetical protein